MQRMALLLASAVVQYSMLQQLEALYGVNTYDLQQNSVGYSSISKHVAAVQQTYELSLLEMVLQGLREKLTHPEAGNAARLSKKLVTIHTDIVLPPVRFPMTHLALHPPTDLTRAAVKAAFASLEFAQHEKRLEAIWDNMVRSRAELSGEAGTPSWHSAVKPASEFAPS